MNGTNATKESNFKFYLILTNLILNSHVWLVATTLEIAVADHLKAFLSLFLLHGKTNKYSFKEFTQMMFLCLN